MTINRTIKKITSEKLQVVNSAIGETTEIHFGWVNDQDLFGMKIKIAEALNHFNPNGTATFTTTNNGNKTLLSIVFVADDFNEGVTILDSNHIEFDLKLKR